MNQQERLDYLVERFKEDSGEYRDLKTPADTEGKKRILRSLMNIRMPKKMAPSVIAVQDEYLKERNRENGIVSIDEIPTVADQGSTHAPNKRAAEIAVYTVTAWLAEHPGQMERVIINVFKDEDKEYYEAELF